MSFTLRCKVTPTTVCRLGAVPRRKSGCDSAISKFCGSFCTHQRWRMFHSKRLTVQQRDRCMKSTPLQAKLPSKNDDIESSVETIRSQPAKGAILVLFVLAAGLAVLAFSQGCSLQSILNAVEEAVRDAGPLGVVLFSLTYALATTLLIPASLLTVAAGYLFGPAAGTAVVSFSSTLGASLAFLVARYLARPLVESKLRDYPRFKAIDSGIAKRGAKVVLLLRLSPLVPFTLLNYLLGLTKVPFYQYVGASWLGMLPGTFAYVYLGGAGRATLDATADAGALDGTKIALYVVGAAATLWATKIISGIASSALNDDDFEQ